MKRFYVLTIAMLTFVTASAQTELTTTEAKTLYKTTTKKRVSVHDPSVVWEPNSQRYYIFGSHRAQAWTTDLQNWTTFNSPWKVGSNNNAGNDIAFVTPAVKKVKKGGVEVDFPQFNAMEWAGRTDASYNINGNMWAPDVIYNTTMQKWCQYLSINGDQWHSSIILLTSDNIEGPYLYQGPVVISGFDSGSHSYKDTDLELVLDPLSSLPARYNSPWAHTSKPSLPNNIDPCVFYDEEGKLWMAYGSWSGGIFMLELDEETGLRDYDVTYSISNGDPYFGKRIAGGYYVSGEGAYIEHIGDYYYLFMSYGYLSQSGGYEMRVFRSKNPDGPYTDGGSRNAVFSRFELNYGPNAAARGEKVVGPYSDWGFMPQGERAQGHNSIIAAPDGRTYLVYHTRFCNANKSSNEGHQVRVHQVFQNKNGWLVVAPFEYNGETVTDQDIATAQPFTKEQLVGTYQLLIHKFANDHENLEQVTPITITLGANNRITGDKAGSWSIQEGTGYITLNIGGVTYNGVVFEETMDEKNMHAISITAAAVSGVNIWAYKWHPKYELAWQLNNQKMPVSNNMTIKKDVDLYNSIDIGLSHVTIQWTSSKPEVISNYGKYCPYAISEDTEVTLSARLETSGYYWTQDYSVKALCAENVTPSTDTWKDGLVAHYGFDDEALSNSYNSQQTAQLMSSGSTAKPIVANDEPLRNMNVVHLSAGAKGKESYVSMPNPLQDKTLDEGVTLAFWVKLANDKPSAALLGFVNNQDAYVVTGDSYVSAGLWHHVVVTLSRNATAGAKIYVDGSTKSTTRGDCSATIELLAACNTFFLGKGSQDGSPEACFDDVMVYDRVLSAVEVMALNQMVNRTFDFATLMPTTGIVDSGKWKVDGGKRIDQGLYDLQGREVNNSPSTIHYPLSTIKIRNGKKILVR
jgi:arabinan endo-1,5-alpha-L-arabinosidase